MKKIIAKTKNMPIAVVPTMVGAATLSNMYLPLGFTWIRHITMIAATVVLLAYLLKIVCHFSTAKAEYSNTIPASLYAGIPMIIMILGSYYFDFNNTIGKSLWLIGLAIHTIHIIVFTYRNVIKNFNKDTFMPSWFVTYNGIMVSVVVGGVMNEPIISKIVVYYGIAVLCIIMPFMIYRLSTHPINPPVFLTQAIVLAPSSLCVVGYLNVIKEPNAIVVYALYLLVLCSLAFVLYKMPKFFKVQFNPGYAALTFPMAIGIVASVKMSGFLMDQGNNCLGTILKELSGIQIYITTAVIGFILYNFVKMLVDSYKKES